MQHQLVMFLTFFFHWMYKKEIQLVSGVFCYSWHRMASFSFSSCLMRKRVAKSEAMLALLDTFQELHLEW